MMCQRIGLPPTSTIGLGRNSVSSRKRVPSPPHRITTLVISAFQHGCDVVVCIDDGRQRSRQGNPREFIVFIRTGLISISTSPALRKFFSTRMAGPMLYAVVLNGAGDASLQLLPSRFHVVT